MLNLVSTSETIDGQVVQFRAGSVRVKFDPRVGRDQKVTLMLNEINAAPNAVTHAYTFVPPSSSGLAVGVEDTDTVDIPFTRVVAGTYLVRVQVDGAESVLTQDGTGLFVSPSVVFP